jgi:thiamine kinase-like enzyme
MESPTGSCPSPTISETSLQSTDIDLNKSNTYEYDDRGMLVLPTRVHVNSPQCTAQIIRIVKSICPDMMMMMNHETNGGRTTPAGSSNNSKSHHGCHTNDTETVTPASLQVRPLQGGLSNSLYVVSCAKQSVLVRVHPDIDNNSSDANNNNNCLIDRATESHLVSWLGTEHMAPRVYGRFGNGRVEEFYHDCEPISDCRRLIHIYGRPLARQLARLHALVVPEPLRQRMTVSPTTTNYRSTVGACFARTRAWLRLAQQVVNNNAQHTTSHATNQKQLEQGNSTQKLVHQLMHVCQHEWEWVERAFHVQDDAPRRANARTAPREAARRFGAQLVLAHGDCQSLNVLVRRHNIRGTATADDDHETKSSLANNNDGGDDDDDNLRLIDFEYSSLSPRAFDMANTFLEQAQANLLTANWATQYPTASDQRVFFHAYWNALFPNYNNELPCDEFFDELQCQVGSYTVVAHLQWAIWGVVKWGESADGTAAAGIDFDYLAYAQQRLAGYCYHKKQFWPKAE